MSNKTEVKDEAPAYGKVLIKPYMSRDPLVHYSTCNDEENISDADDPSGRKRIGQRFSISGLFYKASRDRKRSSAIYQESIDETVVPDRRMLSASADSNISFDEDGFGGGDSTITSTDGHQKMLTMRDQDQIVQELKKENFDLKLRLYMTQKNSETNDRVDEYEQQLGVVLTKFEEQQRVYEEQQRRYEEQQRKYEEQKRQLDQQARELRLKDEKIQNLSMSISKLSTSMVDIASPKYYNTSTTRGGVQSMYFPESDYDEGTTDECDSEYPFSSTPHQVVSRVAPMRRDNVSLHSYNDGDRLVDNDRSRVSRNSYESASSDPTSQITKNYYHTTINNPQTDNIGVVKPNNSRTVVDVDIPNQRPPRPEQPISNNNKKKKKKGLLNVFKLCSGKSGQAMSREESVYHKKQAPAQAPARVTMTTYSNDVQSS